MCIIRLSKETTSGQISLAHAHGAGIAAFIDLLKFISPISNFTQVARPQDSNPTDSKAGGRPMDSQGVLTNGKAYISDPLARTDGSLANTTTPLIGEENQHLNCSVRGTSPSLSETSGLDI